MNCSQHETQSILLATLANIYQFLCKSLTYQSNLYSMLFAYYSGIYRSQSGLQWQSQPIPYVQLARLSILGPLANICLKCNSITIEFYYSNFNQFKECFKFKKMNDQNNYIQSTNAPSNNHQRRQIGNDAVWTLSSAKTGNGVQQLRDDNLNSFWQSDGSQPHLINIQFMKKTRVQQISLYFDFKSDESYTPSKISIRAGNNLQDLKQVQFLQLKQPSGWFTVPLKTKLIDNSQKNYISILQNQHSGKDTHIRQIKIFGPREKINQGLGFPDFKAAEITQYYSVR